MVTLSRLKSNVRHFAHSICPYKNLCTKGILSLVMSRSPYFEREYPQKTATVLLNKGNPDLGVVRSNVGVVRSNWGVVRSNLGVVRSNLGVVRSNLGVVRSNLGVVRSNWGVVRSNLGVVSYCGILQLYTVEPLYNTIVFHQNTHKRHPIARP